MLNKPLRCEQSIDNPIISLDSTEVEWLFQIDEAILEKWISIGILKPAVPSECVRLFWRKDVANLLAAIGV